MPAATNTVSPSVVALIPVWMVANGLASDPSPVWSEPVVDTCQTYDYLTFNNQASVVPPVPYDLVVPKTI